MNKVDYKSNLCSTPPVVVVVQSSRGIKGLNNAFVHVLESNTTYFVDSCYEMTVISQGDVFIDDYDASNNPLWLRGQSCFDFKNNKQYVFNNRGEYRTITLEGGE